MKIINWKEKWLPKLFMCLLILVFLSSVVLYTNVFIAEAQIPEENSISNIQDECVSPESNDFIDNQQSETKSETLKDPEEKIDYHPVVTIGRYNNIIQISMTSSEPSEVLFPQAFAEETLEAGFKEVAEKHSNDDSLWEELNNSQTVCLRIGAYPVIAKDAVTQNVVNNAVSAWSKYTPNRDDVKIKIDSIYIARSTFKEVTFDENDCIHDLPYCNRIDIESVNWANNCINNMLDLNEIYIHNYSEHFDKDDLKAAVCNVKEQCLCRLKVTWNTTDYLFEYTNNNTWAQLSDDIDVEPKVSIDGSTIVMESSRTQQSKSQHFTAQTLRKSLNTIWNNTEFWNKVKENPNINLSVSKYKYVDSESICLQSIEDAIKWCADSAWDKKHLDYKIKNIYLPCAWETEVYLAGSNVIHDLPDCTLIDIERAYFGKDCITNMPSLDDIIVRNREDGYDAATINRCITNVKDSCLVDVRRHLRVNDKCYVFDGKNGIWNELSDRTDLNPSVGFGGNGLTITSSGTQSTYNQAFTKYTLKRAFQMASKCKEQGIWDIINSKQAINIRIDAYTFIYSDSISQDIINDLVKYWDKYVPKDKDAKLKINEINFIDSASTSVHLEEENCVHDLPFCASITVKCICWPKSSKACINNCPDLKNITIDNKSDGVTTSELNSYVTNVSDKCDFKLFRGIFWKDLHYIYHKGNGWKEA